MAPTDMDHLDYSVSLTLFSDFTSLLGAAVGTAQWRGGCRAALPSSRWRRRVPCRARYSLSIFAWVSGSDVTVAVSMMRKFGCQATVRLPPDPRHRRQDRWRWHNRPARGLCHGGAAVILGEEILVVARKDQIEGVACEHFIVFETPRMGECHDEIGTAMANRFAAAIPVSGALVILRSPGSRPCDSRHW